MFNFKKVNNLTGWLVFFIAAVVYTLTVEPTASFWDCGEFIAVSYKLMVPHPPGAPFFLLVGRMFSLLAADVMTVAFWINMSSVLCSAFTILFLFWTITLLGRKVLKVSAENLTSAQTFSLMGAGVVGALAYTFSDSFWFSAVEAEVYAMSSFFTAFVFWAILKWELIEDESSSNRWLLLIAYMIGLSIGVHLLNLVAMPALGLVYYFKRHKQTSAVGIITALLISGAIIMAIMVGIIPGLPSLAGKMEIFFVNNLGLPFGSGILFFTVLFLGGLVYGIYYSIKKQNAVLNTSLLSLAFILIGYASYAIILIRAEYNPPINENNPSDVLTFVYYLKREQYGDRPLLYGPNFNAQLVDQQKGEPLYRKGETKYEIYDYKLINEFDPKGNTLLPRMHSRQPGHEQLYRQIVNLKEGERPNLGDNLAFLFKHQLGHMYFRYFMWNFVGRESDIEGAGWLSPLSPGRDELPFELATNKGRNNFFMLPFILGLVGFLYHYGKDKRRFFIVTMLFFLTGIALILYLNSPPVEPRERDYIYVGSFYAFAIWIGLGVMALAETLGRIIKNPSASSLTAGVVCLVVPGVMAAQGWDDHNRSKRYHSVDSAKNLLSACAPNAILFTGGDNDTFPLWYVQEVEGFRTDVRVCNLSLLGTEWYIQQMKRPTYESKPLPISLELPQYISGKNEQIPLVENPNVKNGISLPQYIDLVRKDNPAIKIAYRDEQLTVLPSSTLVQPVDKQKVLQSGIIMPSLRDSLTERMVWNVNRGDLLKPDLIILDMITTNNWERPIYFSSTLAPSSYLNLKEFMQVEGLVYRLLPVKVAGATQGYINSDLMYENMMKKMYWREMGNPNVYYDDNYRRFPINARLHFYRLADQLLNEGKKDKARAIALHSLEVLPDAGVPYDEMTANIVSVLVGVGETKKAQEVSDILSGRADQNLNYYLTKGRNNQREIQTNLYVLNQVAEAFTGKKEGEKYKAIFDKHYNNLVNTQGGL
ncbi:DUF2723 domain-containing protein [Rhodocytophaga rosea]|uniref:DUF2723 domain-containing protein n=1 Tax=Rhodocytophaga rosea TaxID=2704465 RepID=A0A6C0GKH6_9BACT|nr:DUF2723 domain-containing protein [Rhodocytophaga rosea]QHT68173.1 DUF2723 domain-containing protein [Rhodocytophaga rosea]